MESLLALAAAVASMLVVPVGVLAPKAVAWLRERWEEWRWSRAHPLDALTAFDPLDEDWTWLDELEGTVWIEDEGTVYIADPDDNPLGYGFYVSAFDEAGNEVWRLDGGPLRGIPIVRRLDELEAAGRAELLEHNCGYPLVYRVRAADLPTAGLTGDEWLRVEACDAS